MNIDSGGGLIGTIVFPEGELMTWSQRAKYEDQLQLLRWW